uniref:Vacuolar fusion protein MON1 homolog n=1 Tax=Romanomermis culicivorax TaxID=13658 RepID=A0A915J393_ROMCU
MNDEFENDFSTDGIEFDETVPGGSAYENLIPIEEDVISDEISVPRTTNVGIIAELEAETAKENNFANGHTRNPRSPNVVDDEISNESESTIVNSDLNFVCDTNEYPPPRDDARYYSELRRNRDQFFILSDAGKPIYSRHGNEEDNAELNCLMQALISFVESDDSSSYSSNNADNLLYVNTGTCKICFLHRPPLILVALSKDPAVLNFRLKQQLTLIYNQIVSLLTASRLTKIFEEHKNFDLRRLLTNTNRIFDSLIRSTESDAACMFNAVRCLDMAGSLRDIVNQTLTNSIGKTNAIVFAIILSNSQLVAISRMKKYTLHPLDLGLLINLVATNSSYKNCELWIPICLPRLDSSGFLYAHISKVSEMCDACMILLTVDRNSFFILSQVRTTFVEKLLKSKTLQSFIEACNVRKNVRLSETQITDTWHFLYKNRSSSQIVCPEFEQPYNNEKATKRLMNLYFALHNFMHSYYDRSTNILKIYFVNGDKENLLGWITGNFELYAVFNPLVSKTVAIGSVERLMRWLKKEEDRLFILNPVLL